MRSENCRPNWRYTVNCEWTDLVLLAKMGELSAADAHDAEEHAQSCQSCQKAWAFHQALQQRIKAQKPPEPSAAAWQRMELRIWDAIEGTSEVSWWQRFGRSLFPRPLQFQPSWVLAALVVLLFFPAMLEFKSKPPTNMAAPMVTTEEEIARQLEQLPGQVLPDAGGSSGSILSSVSSETILAYIDEYSLLLPKGTDIARIDVGSILNGEENF